MTRPSGGPTGSMEHAAIDVLVAAVQATCVPDVLPGTLAGVLGEVVREEQAGSVVVVHPGSPAWAEIRIWRRDDGQVDNVDLVPADGVELGPEALHGIFGKGSEGDRLHWEDKPTIDFTVVNGAYRCSIFARVGHPVFDRDRPGIHRVTIRRDGSLGVEDEASVVQAD
jgi:hypothetical protein